MRPAVIVWGDAWDDAGEQDLRLWKHGPYITHTCGWVFTDDDTGVSLCQEWWPEHREHYARHPTFIPRGMIISIKYLD